MHQIQTLNHRHEQIINWLLANPDKTLGDCAKFFNYTQAWLSQVIHSDMFQMEYQARARELGGLVVHTLNNELTALASEAIQASRERIRTGGASERFIADTTKNVLERLGYGSPKVGNEKVQVNVLVSGAEIMAARQRATAHVEMLRGASPTTAQMTAQVDSPDPGKAPLDVLFAEGSSGGEFVQAGVGAEG